MVEAVVEVGEEAAEDKKQIILAQIIQEEDQ